MSIRRVAVALSVQLLVSGMFFAGPCRAMSDDPVMLNADLQLTTAEQASLAIDAMKGSPTAARKLGTYHFTYRGDRTQALKWYTVGAENGDLASAFGLYSILNASKDEEERLRAMFWLHKAADGGFGYARDELKALGQ
ncbi:hypothetical protein KPL74_04590 [Bacillus sp. NP157]|nr:hypothetical protein KPL74_04590 [Bacillus sp. NP157]